MNFSDPGKSLEQDIVGDDQDINLVMTLGLIVAYLEVSNTWWTFWLIVGRLDACDPGPGSETLGTDWQDSGPPFVTVVEVLR